MDYEQYTEEEALAIAKIWKLSDKFYYSPRQNNILPNDILEKYKLS